MGCTSIPSMYEAKPLLLHRAKQRRNIRNLSITGARWLPIGALARLFARAHTRCKERPRKPTAYQDFLTLWKDADPDIPILKKPSRRREVAVTGAVTEALILPACRGVALWLFV
jgi:hypothetical protein